MENIKKEIERIIREAGRRIKNVDYSQMSKRSKLNFRDICTEHDEKTQLFLFTELAKVLPQARFIGEEGKHGGETLDGYCFIIDPIDGTSNFSFDYHHSAISIALLYNGERVLGYVYNPYLDELFFAEKGKGSFLNEKRLEVYDTDLSHSLLGIGTSPYHLDLAEETFSFIFAIYPHVLDIRRCGSAALDICYLAANRQHAFYEAILQPWDYAAASLILEEAGGVVTQINGEPLTMLEGCSVAGGNIKSHKELLNFYKNFKFKK